MASTSNALEISAAPMPLGESAPSCSPSSADPRPYKCVVDVAFDSPTQAKHAMDVLSVDGELGEKVVKNFALVLSEVVSEDDAILRV